MQTNSYISAAALAAALLATPVSGHAQGLGLNLNLGGLGLGVDANVNVGGPSLVGVDANVNAGGSNGVNVGAGASVGGGSVVDAGAGVSVGGSSGINVDAGASVGGSSGVGVDAGVNVGGSNSGGSLVDLDLTGSTGSGPNGGALIDLNANLLGNDALLDTNVTVPGGSTAGSGLISGDIRIGALGAGDRPGALLDLINSPNLADLDLDAIIDDRRVSITAVADLLGQDDLIDINAVVDAGGPGRDELMAALTGSVELGAILDREGIDLEDVLALQIAENGAVEVIVLEGVVDVALLGDNGDLADLGVGDLADLDIDLLSDEELLALDLTLLPEPLASAVRLRLLGNDGIAGTPDDVAGIDIDLLPGLGGGTDGGGLLDDLLGQGGDLADLTVDELANLDLDLLSDEELAGLDLTLLPEPLASAVEIRLLGNDAAGPTGPVGNLATIDLNLLGGLLDDDDGGTGGTPGTGTPGAGNPGTGNPGTGNPGAGNPGTGGGDPGTPGTGNPGTGSPGTGDPGAGDPGTGGNPGTGPGRPSTNDPGTGTGDPGTGGSGDGSPGTGTTPGTGTGNNPGTGGTGNPAAPAGTAGNGTLLPGSSGPTPVGARFGIAALDCDIGVLALASGVNASPAAIAGADNLELVRIEGCQRILMDTEVEAIRAALAANRVITYVLDEADIPLEQVVGATIQGGTLTVFVEPAETAVI